jgi:hypothetical protein
MNGTALSRVYTLENIVNRVLSRLDVDFPKANLKPKIVAEANAQQKIIAEKLVASGNDMESMYYQPATITFTNGERTFDEIEALNPLVIKVVEVVGTDGNGSNYGIIPFVEPENFKSISNSVYYDNGIFYTVEGRRVKLYVGQEVNSTGYTFKITYLREPNILVSATDFMDLPSSKFDELVLAVLQSLNPKDKVEDK